MAANFAHFCYVVKCYNFFFLLVLSDLLHLLRFHHKQRVKVFIKVVHASCLFVFVLIEIQIQNIISIDAFLWF